MNWPLCFEPWLCLLHLLHFLVQVLYVLSFKHCYVE